MNTYDGRESSDTFKESFLLRIYSCTDTGGVIYCIIEGTCTRVKEGFSHISFSSLYTLFLPIISFLLGIRLDGMMMIDVYVLFLPAKAWS